MAAQAVAGRTNRRAWIITSYAFHATFADGVKLCATFVPIVADRNLRPRKSARAKFPSTFNSWPRWIVAVAPLARC